jgi:hypothetical protein
MDAQDIDYSLSEPFSDGELREKISLLHKAIDELLVDMEKAETPELRKAYAERLQTKRDQHDSHIRMLLLRNKLKK